MATYQGGCHCGRIAFTVEGEIDQVMECNCSMCAKRGGLLWFAPRGQVTLTTSEDDLATYTFNAHKLRHRFCPNCGIAPFSEGDKPGGGAMAAINVRCLAGVDVSAFPVVQVDGRSF